MTISRTNMFGGPNLFSAPASAPTPAAAASPAASSPSNPLSATAISTALLQDHVQKGILSAEKSAALWNEVLGQYKDSKHDLDEARQRNRENLERFKHIANDQLNQLVAISKDCFERMRRGEKVDQDMLDRVKLTQTMTTATIELSQNLMLNMLEAEKRGLLTIERQAQVQKLLEARVAEISALGTMLADVQKQENHMIQAAIALHLERLKEEEQAWQHAFKTRQLENEKESQDGAFTLDLLKQENAHEENLYKLATDRRKVNDQAVEAIWQTLFNSRSDSRSLDYSTRITLLRCLTQ